MENNIQELLRKIEDQEYVVRSAKVSGFMVERETDKLKNIIINNLPDIIGALKSLAEYTERVKELEADLSSADAELKEMDDEIKRLRDAAASKPASKGKTKTKEEPVDVADLPERKF